MSKQSIFDRLRAAGVSVAGALALMGNWDCESNLEPCRLQGDFSTSRGASHAYADNVDNGSMSRLIFAGDAKGWGLAQWTFHTRKRDLYDFCRWRSISIANETVQVDFAVHELQNDYPALWQALCAAADNQLYAMTDRVCREYERPAINNVEDRFQAARRLRDSLDLSDTAAVSAADTTPAAAADTPTTPFWPPRMLTRGMVGSDVATLQAALIARGYGPITISGTLDAETEAAMWSFQGDAGLRSREDFGPKSWGALLTM